MTLSLTEKKGARPRTVSGRPNGKPIVDITGRDVVAAFPACAAVEVVFKPGVISITPATRNEGTR